MTDFSYFVVLADMRTGSNFLEANLNKLDGVSCHGEAFNPSFLGHSKGEILLGFDLEAREADPLGLLDQIKQSDAMPGFRFFHNHDQRVLQACLEDPTCAKIILTRNPVDSFVSWKIAQQTGQWKLTNATHSKSTKIDFDIADFEAHLNAVTAFQDHVQRALQTTGQTAFHIGYDDLRDVDVVNGLAAFLGTPSRLSNINKKLKKQNPDPLNAKVRNFAQMQEGLRKIDAFDLMARPHFEPKRGPAIPTYIAAAQSGLLYMPLRSGPDRGVCDWLAALDGAEVRAGFTQRSLREWQARHSTHRSFAVLRHPVARAHAAFCDRVLSTGPEALPEIRANLRRVHKLKIPEHGTTFSGQDGYDTGHHRAAFAGFLKFLKSNLSGQTSIRVDPTWASQNVLLQGMAQFAVPDAVLREDDLNQTLPQLAQQIGIAQPPVWVAAAHAQTGLLSEIYDPTIETAAREAYTHDYRIFGFQNWA